VGLLALKSPKLVFFWYKFAQKGYIPLSNFYKIWREGATPRPAPLAKFNHCHF